MEGLAPSAQDYLKELGSSHVGHLREQMEKIIAAEEKMRVRFFTAADLVEMLYSYFTPPTPNYPFLNEGGCDELNEKYNKDIYRRCDDAEVS